MHLLTLTDQNRCTVKAILPAHRLLSVNEMVTNGLAQTPKRLPPILFYDAEGSRLFEEICKVPEYYLTRTEKAILDQHAQGMVASCDTDIDLVELGSGNAQKTRTLLDALFAGGHAVTYRPIDISRSMLERTALELTNEYSDLVVEAVASDYHTGLAEVGRRRDRQKGFLFMGSNLGNFPHDEARDFLAAVGAAMAPGDFLLLGVDLVKDQALLEAAYDDAAGVTRAFNMNLLTRLNRELGADFDLQNFRHKAVWDPQAQAIQTYLVSMARQTVHLPEIGMVVDFDDGEAMHTESSHKYTLDGLAGLCREAGLLLTRTWTDDRDWFAVNLVQPLPAQTGR